MKAIFDDFQSHTLDKHLFSMSAPTFAKDQRHIFYSGETDYIHRTDFDIHSFNQPSFHYYYFVRRRVIPQNSAQWVLKNGQCLIV